MAYGQNGEPIRPAHGFPIRLILPGLEGNLNIKWLRRLKFGDQPWMTRWETARYTQLLANGKARQFQLRMETNSVITQPSGTMQIQPGYNRISGLAWSGHGKIAKVEISTDGAKTWKEAQLNLPVLPKAQTRFQMDWTWDGKPTKIVSRSTDEKGNVQPDRAPSSPRWGRTRCFTTTPSRPGASTRREGSKMSCRRIVAALRRRRRWRLCRPQRPTDFGRPRDARGDRAVGHRRAAGRQGPAARRRHGGPRQAGVRGKLRGAATETTAVVASRIVWSADKAPSPRPCRSRPSAASGPMPRRCSTTSTERCPTRRQDRSASTIPTPSLPTFSASTGSCPRKANSTRQSLPKIRMPNRDGFIPEPEFSRNKK